jgi:dihydroorotase (multifunctional complex type)
MNGLDVIVKNGQVALPDGLHRLDVGIKDGRIAALSDSGGLQGSEIHDASGKLVLPGAIDMHVHFREPGFTDKEDFAHGTAAAACGGVTMVCDMPNTRPPVISADRFTEKLTLVSSNAHVDFALWAGGTQTAGFREMDTLGAIGLKIYMNRAVRSTDPYASELSMPDDAQFVQTLVAAAALDWPVSVHVANSVIDEAKREQLQSAGFSRAADVCCSFRSPESVEALSRAALFARLAGAKLHVAHISLNSIFAIDALIEARRQGAAVTAEVVPPALSFDELERVGVKGVPFAHPAEQLQKYWDALEAGIIDAVATDHAPHTRAEKEGNAATPWLAPPGYPGVETSIPLLIDAMLNGKIRLATLTKICAENPAAILGITQKGSLLPGHDADINIVDPEASWVIDEARLHSKAGWSPYHGRKLKGRISKTLLRGKVVAIEGELVDKKPGGKMVRRSAPRDRFHEPPRLSRRIADKIADLPTASLAGMLAFKCTEA